MNWGRRATVVLAALLLGGSIATGTAGAATSKDVCGSTSTPTGWIEVKYWDDYQCGRPGGGMYNMKRIKDTSGVGAGGTVPACTYSPIPSGFHITRYSSISDCNRSRATGDYHNQVGLVKLTGLPKGTMKTICGAFGAPSGWTVYRRARTTDCESYKYGYPSHDNAMTILKS